MGNGTPDRRSGASRPHAAGSLVFRPSIAPVGVDDPPLAAGVGQPVVAVAVVIALAAVALRFWPLAASFCSLTGLWVLP